jgi:nicotinate-nucleotide adenylyltransferase
VTQLAIAATAIREGLARGQSPRFLVPDGVWNMIRESGLYGWEETASEAVDIGEA